MASTTLLGFGVASTTLLGFGVASTTLFQSRFGWTRPHVEELPEFSMNKKKYYLSHLSPGLGGLECLVGREGVDRRPPSCRSYRSFLLGVWVASRVCQVGEGGGRRSTTFFF